MPKTYLKPLKNAEKIPHPNPKSAPTLKSEKVEKSN
jgi:hypothetical protein